MGIYRAELYLRVRPACAEGMSHREAIVVGSELSAPMPVQMMAPSPNPHPSSLGPDDQASWQGVTERTAQGAT